MIVSKDSDFLYPSPVTGDPPKVVRLAWDNCLTADIVSLRGIVGQINGKLSLGSRRSLRSPYLHYVKLIAEWRGVHGNRGTIQAQRQSRSRPRPEAGTVSARFVAYCDKPAFSSSNINRLS